MHLKPVDWAAQWGLWLFSGLCLGLSLGCGGDSAPKAKPLSTPDNVRENATQANAVKPATKHIATANPAKLSDEELEAHVGGQIKTFCSYCHPVPLASDAPREEWRNEVEQAYKFHRNSPRKDEPAPDINAVIAYFERKATPYDKYSVPLLSDTDPGKLRFETTTIQLDPAWTLPAVSGISWAPSHRGDRGSLFVCEMRSGGLYQVNPGDGKNPPTSIPIVKSGSIFLANPCHVQPCDLDNDGQIDLVVADLGTFYPKDETLGRVVWLRRTSPDGYEPVEIASTLGRVADVQPGDFDGDGDQDLVVGEFGWQQTGSIRLLKNLGSQGGRHKFEMTTLDPRHGTIQVPVLDMNGDGKLDFVAVIGQEHEAVEAFLGHGDGTFETQRIYSGPSPSWGSSGIQLVDLDKDQDLDILYANGDHFDRTFLRPYHAIHWLENRGSYPWVHHELAKMPGCHRALAGDMDGDGDLDVVAASMLHVDIRDRFGKESFEAVCWLEQTTPGKFARRTLSVGNCDHPTFDVGDFDADGDVDLAVGNFFFNQPRDEDQPPSLTIWWNETPRPPAKVTDR